MDPVLGPAFFVLGAGLLVGVFAALSSRGTDATIAVEAERNDLQSTYDEVMTALKQLELDEDKLDPADYAAERKALLARGSAALRALQGAEGPRTPTASRFTLTDLPDLPMPPGADDTLDALRDLLDEHGSKSFRAAIVALAKERPKAVVPALVDGAVDEAEAATVPPAPTDVPRPQPLAPPPEPGALAPQYQGALAVVAILALLGALWYVMQGDVVDRREGAGMTGNQDLGTAAPGPAPGPGAPGGVPPMLQKEINDYEKALEADATDIVALNGLTEIYLGIGDAGKAMDYNNKAIAAAPDDPTARTFKAVLRAMVGMFAPAIADLEAIVAENPDHAQAWTYLGLIAYDKGDKNRGVEALRKAVELQPDNFGLKQALQRAEAGQPLSGGGPPPPPPADGGNSGGEPIVSGTIALPDGTQLKGTEVVFVSLRSPEGGPPLAAKRLRASDLPGAFTVTTGDRISMGGAPGPLPATVNVVVRVDVDNDGNAFTKTPMDPTATLEGVAPGSSGLSVQLALP